MNSSFLTWFAVAGALALGLLLLLGGAPPETDPLEVTEAETATYWEPVGAAVPSPATYYTVPVAAPPVSQTPCPPCATYQPVPVNRTPVAGGISGFSVERPATSGCGLPCSPCPSAACPHFSPSCGGPCVPVAACMRPGINRNMALCVDECSYIQLRATVPQPICDQVSFLWEATKGSFLNPTGGDPIYYAPTTHFPAGEDVWIILTVTDSSGARYNDQVKLHINNTR